MIERFGADALRFYCFREVSFGQDGSISPDGFETRYETELANELRQPGQPHAGDDRPLPRRQRARGRDPDPALAGDLDGLAARVAELLDRAELTAALDEIWQRVRRLNRYVEERAPWQLAKDPRPAASSTVALRSLAEGLRVVAGPAARLHARGDAARCWPRSGSPSSTLAARALRCAPRRRR